MKHDVFDLSDATIRDTPYVTVRRLAPRLGSRCVYQKVFKRDVEFGDFTYWTERENDFLWLFARAKAKHVVEPQQFSFEPSTFSVNTFDAGITIGDWLRVRPSLWDGTTLSHPFQRATDFLRLIRACLVALEEIHRHHVVHCDIKDDNICLPYAPYPYREGEKVRIDFDGLRLIDFAFAITPHQRLAQPLPIEPNAAYQSAQLKAAIREDNRNKSVSAVQRLDYRVDLYSLGHMGERFLEGGLIASPADGDWILERARKLVSRLKAFGDSGSFRASAVTPHRALIAEIDDSLNRSAASSDLLEFSVAGLWTAREVERGLGGVHTTPVTPIASPVARAASSVSDSTRPAAGPGRKIATALAAAAALAGVATVAIHALPDLTTVSATQSELPAVAAAPDSLSGAVPMRAVAAHSEEAITHASAQLRDRDDEAFAEGFRALMKSASQSAPDAAELATRIVNEYSRILTSSDSEQHRRQAFVRLTIAARSGSDTAAQTVGAFEKAYDQIKTPILKSTWWSRGEGARPSKAQRWIEDGSILSAAGDRPAMLDRAFAIGHGRGLEQDRAQSVRLYRQVIERSADEDPFSKALRASAVRGLSSMLNAVVSGKDHGAAVGLQPQMEATAKAGAADMQFYLGLFSECVADPPDFDVAREWYRKAAMNAAWKSAAERKLAVLGKWCPADAN